MYLEFNDRIEKAIFVIFERDETGDTIIGITDNKDQANSICTFLQSSIDKRMFTNNVFYHFFKVDLIKCLEEY